MSLSKGLDYVAKARLLHLRTSIGLNSYCQKRSQGGAASKAQAAMINRGTCAPLPFHVTGGQPTVGQGVVVHDEKGTYLQM
ncbi:unnamed protein product [Spirodela intermedia]|uniref:Uncharacterized protein n=1 Tax=Spirodela intermedia TaxID=51605 RepID=A0ABN7E8M5_SPIIN|nr:unnamed protein product [Spirodela intermedia]